jgi:hypothetical protein
MSRRHILIAGFILVLLTGGSVATLLALTGGGKDQGAGASQRPEGSAATTGPEEPESGSAPIRFVLGDSYEAGETIKIVIQNIGTRAYVFQSYYQACFLSYFDSSGRRLIIPPGTHCDLLAEDTIRPGERRKLFTWALDECVKDNWGCAKSRPLMPGTYTIKGRFKPKHAGPRAQAEATFTIVAA